MTRILINAIFLLPFISAAQQTDSVEVGRLNRRKAETSILTFM